MKLVQRLWKLLRKGWRIIVFYNIGNCITVQYRHTDISLGQFSSEGGESATLQEQIIRIKGKMAAAQTEIKAADLKTKHNTEQLKKKQVEMKKTEAEYKRDSGAVGKYEKDVADLNNKLSKINYVDGSAVRLEEQQRTLRQEVQ